MQSTEERQALIKDWQDWITAEVPVVGPELREDLRRFEAAVTRGEFARFSPESEFVRLIRKRRTGVGFIAAFIKVGKP